MRKKLLEHTQFLQQQKNQCLQNYFNFFKEINFLIENYKKIEIQKNEEQEIVEKEVVKENQKQRETMIEKFKKEESGNYFFVLRFVGNGVSGGISNFFPVMLIFFLRFLPTKKNRK